MPKPLPPVPKAYKNLDFLNSTDAATIRILSEYLEPLSRFEREKIKETIVFFGSARVLPRKSSVKILKETRASLLNNKKLSKSDKVAIEDAERGVAMSKYYEDAVRLSYLLSGWAKGLNQGHRFVICSGGGPGIMEAANKGAYKAGALSMGLNISLPMEQFANLYISKNLNFEFHYFFMRKLWFMHLAKAMVMFPGGFGTMDEMMEVMTLIQTQKVKKYVPIVLYGPEYWKNVINFDVMLQHGTILARDLKLFRFVDNPEEAFEYLKGELTRHYLDLD